MLIGYRITTILLRNIDFQERLKVSRNQGNLKVLMELQLQRHLEFNFPKMKFDEIQTLFSIFPSK
jgi:hypothetical protein